MKDISTRYTIKYILLYHEFVHLCISDEFWQGTCLIFKYTVYTISHAQSIFNIFYYIFQEDFISKVISLPEVHVHLRFLENDSCFNVHQIIIFLLQIVSQYGCWYPGVNIAIKNIICYSYIH